MNYSLMKHLFIFGNIVASVFIFIFQISCQSQFINVNKTLASNSCDSLNAAPFHGTIFIDPDIVTPDDPTTFLSLVYIGTAERVMFDRRIADWVTLNPFLFIADYDDSIQIEIQINPEFSELPSARFQAEKFAPIIGQLSTELRKDVKTVWIHKGNYPFGGGNNNLLIHTDYSKLNYEDQGILEETLIHEAAHTSLDAYHANDSLWNIAQILDCRFISSYAQENPLREDIAESFLPYFAIRYRPERISNELKKIIESSIPNRIIYFDKMDFNMYPVKY